MTNSRSTRILRGAVAGIALVVMSVGLGSAPSWADAAPPAPANLVQVAAARELVGTWDATVDSGTKVLHPTLTFAADGSVRLVAEHDAYVAGGSWHPTGKNTFAFAVTHPLLDDNGKVIGSVKGQQSGRVSGDTFASVGPSQLYDLSGNRLGDPITVHITGARRY